MQSHRYDSLDAVRGIAALMVVFHHCFRAVADTSSGLVWWFEHTPLRLLVSGRPAVILFFVLSGFVLALALEKGARYRDFVIRRICRIYLPFAASIILAALIYSALDPAALPGYSPLINRLLPVGPELLAGHLLMLGDAHNSTLNPVMWSLVYELRISLIFPLIFWLTYRFPVWRVLAASLAAALVSYAALRHLGYGPRELHFSTSAAASLFLTIHFMLYFVIGAALAKHRERLIGMARAISPPHRLTLLAATSALMLAMNMAVTDITLGLLSAAIIVYVLAGGTLVTAILQSRPAAFLGKISYSLYLVHMPVFVLAAHAWPGGAMPIAYIWLIWPPLALAAGTLAYWLIERPSQELGRWIVAKLNARPVRTMAVTG